QALVGGQRSAVVAESPRQVVLMSPPTPTGPVPVQITDGARSLTGAYRNVSVSLSTPRTTLRRGERAQVAIRVEGLQGAQAPLQLLLQASPTISLDGGNRQMLTILPSDANASGAVTRQIGFRVLAVGPFDISARVSDERPTR